MTFQKIRIIAYCYNMDTYGKKLYLKGGFYFENLCMCKTGARHNRD